jgi:hypothetical protein
VERVIRLEGFSGGDELVHHTFDTGGIAGEITGNHPVPVEDLVAG